MTSLQLFPALDSTVEAALKSSIERFGVLVPVVRNQHGLLLDGNHRVRIAKELGVDCPCEQVQTEDDWEDREIARSLNEDRRHLTIEQRRPVVVALKQEGHSNVAIGKALGVSEGQVRQDIKAEQLRSPTKLPDRTTGLDGKSRPATKPRKPREGQKTDPYAAEGVKAQQIAEKNKRKLSEGMGMANGIARGLVELDFGAIAAVSTKEEIKAWQKVADDLVGALRKVKSNLKEVVEHAQTEQ